MPDVEVHSRCARVASRTALGRVTVDDENDAANRHLNCSTIEQAGNFARAPRINSNAICFQSAQNRLLIKNGKVVNDDEMIDSDVYIEDGIIRYRGRNFQPRSYAI